MAIERTLTAKGEPRYEVRYRGPDGRERSFRTRKAAEAYERDQRNLREHGGWADPRASRLTLAAWSHEWLRTIVHLRPSTRRIYEDNLRLHVLPSLGAVPLGKLTKTDLWRWLAELSAGDLAPASVHQAYRCRRRVLGAAVGGEVLVRNPPASSHPRSNGARCASSPPTRSPPSPTPSTSATAPWCSSAPTAACAG